MKEKIIKNIKYFVSAIALAIIGAVVYAVCFQDVIEKWKQNSASEPYVAVLISKQSIDFTIPIDFNKGFFESNPKQEIETKNKKPVKLKHIEDFLSESNSSKELQKLITDENCLLIICNANSTLTNANIDDLITTANTKIPVIMPIATDKTIMEKAKLAQYKGILRMLPDNSKQAKSILGFINYKFPDSKNIVVYGDEENSSYSVNLSREVAEQIRISGGKKILVEELIGPSNSIVSSFELLKKADVIIYVGVSHHASLLIDQLSSFNLSTPLIMTDGCLVASIFAEASNKYENKCYVVSPATLKDDEQYISPYKVIGMDTYNFLSDKVISQSFPTRKSFYETIENIRKGDQLPVVYPSGKYQFDTDGNNIGRDYIMCSIKGGKAVMVFGEGIINQ